MKRISHTLLGILALTLTSCLEVKKEEDTTYVIDEVVEVKFEHFKANSKIIGKEVKFQSNHRHIFSSGIVTEDQQINLMGEDIKAGDKLHLTGQSNKKGEIVRIMKIKKVRTT